MYYILLCFSYILLLGEEIDYDNNIFSYIQVSDTHISKKSKSPTAANFRLLTESVIPAFNTDLIIHSGDITDGWLHDFKTGEVKEEWTVYKEALEKSGYFNSTIWLDVRGNHDNSNQDSSTNHYYRNYSTCGQEGPVYNRQYKRSFGTYCFIGLDATYTPSPGVTMTYYGYVNKQNRHQLQSYLHDDLLTCNHTVVFTHYPSLYLNSPSLHRIYKQYPPSFVLVGHTHSTLGNRANTRINSNTIESVICDFKVRHIFRLYIIDNDFMSYIDMTMDEVLIKPVVFVSNPPNSQYVSDSQKMTFIGMTKYIHIFVYDVIKNNTINMNGFTVSIDTYPITAHVIASSKTPHLYYVPWTPSLYTQGLHIISVTYSNGETSSTYSHHFITTSQTVHTISQTNHTMKYTLIKDAMEPGNNLGGYVINSSFVIVLMALSYTISITLVIFIIVARRTIKRISPHPLSSSFQGRYRIYHLLFKEEADSKIPLFMKSLALVASDTYIAYFFIISLLWQTFGFWVIGKFPNELAIQHLWGMIYIPSTSTGSYSLWLDLYLWHMVFVLFYYIPLLGYYGFSMIPHGMTPESTSLTKTKRMIGQCVSLIYFVGIGLFVKLIGFSISFNNVSMFLAPIWFWFPLFNAILMFRELVFDHHYNKNGAKLCYLYNDEIKTKVMETQVNERKEDLVKPFIGKQ